jgi:4-hydroxy-3-methylbut-2-en-1-yl diphosphate synthase IspG/GcpE
MKKTFLVAVLLALCLAWTQAGFGAELAVKPGDTIGKLLEDHVGKKVTVRLSAGEELTGKVKVVTKEVLHLGGLTGKEFFDAVVDVNKIQAVIVRVKE